VRRPGGRGRKREALLAELAPGDGVKVTLDSGTHFGTVKKGQVVAVCIDGKLNNVAMEDCRTIEKTD
jgi:hypothetical protein